MKKYFTEITLEDVDKLFRIQQVTNAVFKNGICDFASITNLPAPMRDSLAARYTILDLAEETREVSTDGTVKFLFRLDDGAYIEAVFLIDKNTHVTFCISSQVGCRMGCVFCKTGQMGLERNLTAYEILSQVIFLYHFMVHERGIDDRMFNIVFMGMGEPLDNLDAVSEAVRLITAKEYFALAPSRITISTCGLVDRIEPFLERFPGIKIAVSLNNPVQAERELIMPVAKKIPVKKMAELLRKIAHKLGERITLEYVLIKNQNMEERHIEALDLFKGGEFHINVIPLNHSDETVMRPTEKEIQAYVHALEQRGFCVTRRYRRGADIQADCGQLYHSHKKGREIEQ